MVFKNPLTAQDRNFADQYGEPLRELSFRLDPEHGDPEGTVIRKAAEIMYAALGILAEQGSVSFVRAVDLANAQPSNAEDDFMMTDLGARLLESTDYWLLAPEWTPSSLAEEFREQYSELQHN